MPGARVGSDCNICDGVFIENDVSVGDHVTVKCGVQLWDGLTLEDHVFVGPNATFANNLFPRSQVPREILRTLLCKHASVGSNATILPGVRIGQYAMVGAGAVVTRSVPDGAIVYGNPARVVGYVDGFGGASDNELPAQSSRISSPTRLLSVKGVQLHVLRHAAGGKNVLSAGDFEREIPFAPKRYALLCNDPEKGGREALAYKNTHQFFVSARGTCVISVDDGVNREEFGLEGPACGLYMPPMIWGMQSKFSDDAVLLQFASEYYDTDDCIKDYGAFLEQVRP